MTNIRFVLTLLAIIGIFTTGFAQSVRSALYPTNWTPDFTGADGKFLHDFSYAGYEKGEKEVPSAAAMPRTTVYNVVTQYGADNTGADDVTDKIQQAINAAQTAGGGVVYLPAGIYKVRPQGSNNFALRITSNNILLKGDGSGRTFIRCYAEDMRSKTVIQVGQGGNWGTVDGEVQSNIAQNVSNKATAIQLANAGAFKVGDYVIIRSNRTQEWVNEHNMNGFWDARGDLGLAPTFFRRITAINGNTITIDIPVRYELKTRDAARVYRVAVRTQNSGIEGFSIGNKENPATSGFGEEDYNTQGRGAYSVHSAFLIKFSGVINGWAKDVRSYQAGNPRQIHMSSNGFDINQSARLTIDNCEFSYAQYKGGGGNGYGFNIAGSDLLITNSVSTATRHSYAFKYTYSNGVVIHNFRSNDNSLASDFHMYLSLANLIDNQTVNGDFIETVIRPYGATAGNRHGHSSTQTVIWNTNGLRGMGGRIVDSRQYGYGYVIGTRGSVTNIQTTPVSWNTSYGTANTAPEDHKEHIGNGANLEPVSLYRDQLAKRLGNTVTRDSTAIDIPGTFNSTKYVGKSNEVADNGNYVGNLINNSYMDYVIDVKQAGNYRMALNTARSGDAARTVTVSTGNLNGANFSDKGGVTIPAGSDWFAFSPAVAAANFNLSAGKQLLRLKSNGSVNIENITLGIPIDIPSTFYSTQFLNKSSEVSVNEKQYLGNLAAGSYAEYLVNVTSAGEYGITFNTATGNNNNQRTITVSSGSSAPVTLQVINGTDWEAFRPISARIQLNAGVQILRWVSTGAVNIEKITLAAPKPEGDTVVVLNIPNGGYEYNGQAKTPEVSSVSIGSTQLDRGTHYSVSYLNNINAGTAAVRVTGAGTYSNLVKEIPFMIIKKPVVFTMNPKNIEIEFNPAAPMEVEYPITYSGLYSPDNISVFTLVSWDPAGNKTEKPFAAGDIIVECSFFNSQAEGDEESNISDNNSITKGYAPGNYPITVKVDGELAADNYTAVFDDGLMLVVIDPNASSIKAKIVKDNKQGIIINPNPATGEEEEFGILIKTLKPAFVNITIYDNVGNAVFKSEKDVKTNRENFAKIPWDLKNNANRFVANGSYLVVAEVKPSDKTQKTVYYIEKLGIKRGKK